MPPNTSEKGLESLIVEHLVEGVAYKPGRSEDFDREHALDLAKLMEFLTATQAGPPTTNIVPLRKSAGQERPIAGARTRSATRHEQGIRKTMNRRDLRLGRGVL